MNWYQPKTYAAEESLCRELLQAHPLSVWITFSEMSDEPYISYLPTIIDPKNSQIVLTHLSLANPHTKALAHPHSRTQILCQGVDSYVSSRWYVSGRDVPTWYYTSLRLKGTATLKTGDDLVEILRKQTDYFESNTAVDNEAPWEFSLPSDLADISSLDKAIIGVEFRVEKWEGKFKLGQNRSREDREAALNGLAKVKKISNQERLLSELKRYLKN